MQNFYRKQPRKWTYPLFFFLAAIGTGLLFHCFEDNPADSGNTTTTDTDILIKVAPPEGEDRDPRTFFIGESIFVCIEAIEVEPIDTLTFGVLLNPESTINEAVIRAAVDTTLIRGDIFRMNYFPLHFEQPGKYLLGAYAHSKDTIDIDTLYITVVEQYGTNEAPTIQLTPLRAYAAPSLPCSLNIAITDAEPWQEESLSVLISGGKLDTLGTTLCVWTPVADDTAKVRKIAIIVTDNGNPPKSDTGYADISIIADKKVFPPPENLRVVERTADQVQLAWDSVPLADGYKVFRSTTATFDSIPICETTSTTFIDTTAAAYFYKVETVNYFGTSDSGAVIAGRDTLVSVRYSMTYNGNGNTGGVAPIDTNNYLTGSKATIRNQGTLVKKGYSFTAWNTKADGTGAPYKADTVITIGAANDTLYAQWAINRNTVTFDARGGSPVDSQVVNYGDTVKAPIPPSKTGYTFNGWYKDSLCANEWIFAKDTVINTITLYAQWKIKQCKVTYDGNGNTAGTAPEAMTQAYGTKVKISPNSGNLVKANCNFSGWNTQSNGSGIDYFPDSTFTLEASDITLFAKWTQQRTWKITYDGNGITGGSIPVDTITYDSGATATVLGNTGNLVRTGYTYIGWNTNADGSGTSYIAGSPITMNNPITLYAKWTTKPTYTLTYNGNGNTGGAAPGIVISDSDSKVTIAKVGTLEKTNYAFTCWDTLANGTGTNFVPDSTFIMPAADDTLYAKWAINQYAINFDAQGGSAVAPQTVNHGSYAITPTPAPEKTGYRFDGWYKETECVNVWSFSTDAVTTNRTLYAKWTLVFTVSYIGNDHTSGTLPIDANAYTNGQVVTILDNTGSLSKSGYAFVCWNTNAAGTGTDRIPGGTFSMGSVNVLLYSKWTPVYTVTFDGQGATTPASPTTKTVVAPATAINALPTPPGKNGYIFDGWYTEINGGGTEFTTSLAVTANVTIYAKWNSYSYSVTFDDQGATTPVSPTSKIVASPATTIGTLPAPPGKTGFGFGGWYTATTGSGTEFTASTVVTASVMVYAKWDNYSYTITFDGHGATTPASPTSKQVISPLTTVGTLPAPPINTGYTFGGWYTAINGGGTEFSASTIVIGSDTVYAKWNSTYTITFDGQSATTPANPTSKIVIAPATTVDALPGQPTRTGYTFSGWFTASNGGGTAFTASTVVIGSDTVYAKWNSTYTITFDDQGATTPVSPTSKNVISPATTIDVLPAQPTRTGYSFGGWFTAINGGGTAFTASSVVTVGDTVYAKWTVNSYNVTFDKNDGGATGTMTAQTITFGANALLTANGFTKTGYSFAGWATSSGGTVAYNNLGSYAMTTEGDTLFAKWTGNTYYVIFDKNDQDAGGNMDPQPIAFGSTVPLIRNTFYKSIGWIFNGWAKKANENADIWDGQAFTIGLTDVTLYARWMACVNFDTQGGSGSLSGLCVYSGSTIVNLNENPKKEGYTFGGWYREPSCVNKWEFWRDVVTTPMTLYAKWL